MFLKPRKFSCDVIESLWRRIGIPLPTAANMWQIPPAGAHRHHSSSRQHSPGPRDWCLLCASAISLFLHRCTMPRLQRWLHAVQDREPRQGRAELLEGGTKGNSLRPECVRFSLRLRINFTRILELEGNHLCWGGGWSYEWLVFEGGVLTIGGHRLTDINTHCLAEFRKHWECLDNRNQQLWQCRPAEWKLNKCVYDNLVRQSLYHW